MVESIIIMKINCESWTHYLDWIVNGWHFSFAGFSDAEWYCILQQRIGNTTGLGQILDAGHGRKLLDILFRRQHTRNFLFAVPKCLWQMPGFAEGQIDWFLGKHDIKIEGYERDMVLDDCARDAKLYRFIQQLRGMNTVMIGPRELWPMIQHLKLNAFVPISTPNLHMEHNGIEDTVARTLALRIPNAVYLISAGISAAVIIDLLHDVIPDSWFIDCGSIWDGFVGIGGQRQWRADLYADKEKYNRWLKSNLEGK